MGIEHSRQRVHCQCDRKKTKSQKKNFSLFFFPCLLMKRIHACWISSGAFTGNFKEAREADMLWI